MRLMATLLTCCTLMTCEVSVARDDSSLLRAQAEAWDRAIVAQDRAAIERNLHSDFFQIDTRGQRHARAEFVANLMDPQLRIEPYTVPDLEVVQHGDSALLTGTTRMHGTYAGKPFTSHYRYIDSYVREYGRWRVVAVQVTAIDEP